MMTNNMKYKIPTFEDDLTYVHVLTSVTCTCINVEVRTGRCASMVPEKAMERLKLARTYLKILDDPSDRYFRDHCSLP